MSKLVVDGLNLKLEMGLHGDLALVVPVVVHAVSDDADHFYNK